MKKAHTTGCKFEETHTLDIAAIAKLVRAEIKACVAKGTLPKAKYSVTISRYSMGREINVNISNVEAPGFYLYNRDRLRAEHEQPHTHSNIPWMSAPARELVDAVTAIANAYNYDNSDSASDYYDVRFATHVDVRGDRDAELAAMLAEDKLTDAIAVGESLAALSGLNMFGQ